MIPATGNFLRTAALFATACVILATGSACSDSRAAGPSPADGETVPAADSASLSSSSAAQPDLTASLLDMAIGASSAIPVEPHLKDRSRAQEAVVAACLQLDRPQLAIACIEKIDNWRRGTCWADLALHLAQQGDAAGAEQALSRARECSESEESGSEDGGTGQAWRRDRIRAKIARTCLVLGQSDRAASFATDIAAAESCEWEAAQALLVDGDRFDEQLAELDAELATGGFDGVRNALVTCSRLFDRDYAQEGRRAQLKQRIVASAKKLPVAIGLQLMLDLADVAVEHGDTDGARALLDEVQQIVDGQTWLPEDRIRLVATVAESRARAGEAEPARASLAAALALFDAELVRIPDISRAGALRPIAEAYQSMGDTDTARAIYVRAVEAGAVNPNARPRAEDLSATCCSMAVHAVEPGPELLARLAQLREALRAPW